MTASDNNNAEKPEPFFLIARKIFESPLWTETRPRTAFEAWLDLINLAAFEPREFYFDCKLIKLSTGQLCGSFRFFQARWIWGAGRVRRFLDLLKNEHQIDRKTEQGISIITLLNYEKFQRPFSDSGTQTERKRNANGTQTEQYINNLNNIKNNIIPITGLTTKPKKSRAERAAEDEADADPRGERKPWGKFQKVRLTDQEHANLVLQFGLEEASRKIEVLDLYLESTGKRYRSHYATILSWSMREARQAQKNAATGKQRVRSCAEENLDKLFGEGAGAKLLEGEGLL